MPKALKVIPKKKIVKKVKKSSSVIDRISGIEFDEDEGLCCVVYGKSGTGKTTFAGTFPGPILWIVCSAGKRPGELRSLDTPENSDRIQKVVLEKPEEMLELAEYQANEDVYKTIVVDHVTAFQDLVLAQILDLKNIPEQKSWGLASQQQYGQCTLQCKELMRPFLDLSCNRIFIAQERDFSKEESSDLIMPTVGAAVSPALAGWLNSSCDYLVNTLIRPETIAKKIKVGKKVKTTYEETGKVEYCLRVAPHQVYMTKFRIPKGKALPEMLVDPDYDKLYKLIKGKA